MAKNSTTFKPGHKAMGGRPPGSLNRTTIEVRDFARRLIEDPKYQASLLSRMIAGKAPQMEMLLYHYAYGRPGERQEANASARVAGTDGSDLRRSEPAEEDPATRDLRSRIEALTPAARERFRRLTDSYRDSYIAFLTRAGAFAESSGELPPSAMTPPDQPA